MSRAVRYRQFGGLDVLELQEVPEPHAGPDEVRVRVTAAGLNPMDWQIAAKPEMAARFGITLPAGFGSDFAGVVDEAGAEAAGFSVGDRVHGAAIGRSVADFVLVKTPTTTLWRTPESISDEVAATLPVAGLTASAALAAIGLRAGDAVLIGGAAGGVGIFAVQLAKLAGARVLGTASERTFGFLRELGAESVAYGPGLPDRVRALAPEGITAATDLFGREAAEAALELGVAPERISTVADGPALPGVHATGAVDAKPGSLERIADVIRSGELTVPIAATFPVEQFREAVTMQAGRHVHGKIVVTL
ncbi:NADP-dependent oxidoreductase [Amycolatopsis echigonensis]|uniref:NADP-dependent oxidoreductase n=1 Tax=Amycolatopsis echigonensis TaxID=2576905 RepID=A0A2N3WQ79_9PSEU|nr:MULTISPECIES: NADP-dependent oxidoreductase [Amycolatopsis]MBB2502756.1 NADP-dependent oxidoreductase [Amycolatopsis echigonensis]PKV96028.1 NADPH:quinone reductase-like Zn-dependent oxidoreductase [Amycolatopsis niigatensis]